MSTDQPVGGARDPWEAPTPPPPNQGGAPLPFEPPPGYVPTTERRPEGPPPAGPWPTPPAPGGWAPPPYGQGAQPGYGSGYGYGGVPQAPQNDKGATRALVLGIISLIVCGVILGPAAIYEGRQARTRIQQSGGALTGDGMALAGMILGLIGAVGAVLILILTFSSSGGGGR